MNRLLDYLADPTRDAVILETIGAILAGSLIVLWAALKLTPKGA